MQDFGHAFGVRDDGGTLRSVAGVNFVLARQSYAQIGNVATDPDFRRRGWATSALGATVASLHRSGIRECGLFADAQNAWLQRFYTAHAFRERGRFRFHDLRP